MEEGPFKEDSYWFPGEKIGLFMNTLPQTDECEDEYLPDPEDRILIMTHDDTFCEKMHEMESSAGIRSTWFLLANRLAEDMPAGIDAQLHFDKQSRPLSDQMESFEDKTGTRPRFNRNHRLIWKSANLDFPLMAMNGIKLDSTLTGTRPFRPCINGRKPPIWELPFCIGDRPEKAIPLYSTGRCPNTAFQKGLSPIVVLAHPFSVCREASMTSCFHEVLDLVSKYSYRSMTVTEFYEEYIQRRSGEYRPCHG